jgi:type III pantothenate kinase
MLLAIDIGNTNIQFGMYDTAQKKWIGMWRSQTVHDRMSDEYAVLLRSFFDDHFLTFDHVSAMVLASVVPHLTVTFSELAERYFQPSPLIVDSTTPTPVPLRVDHPNQVGPDRIVNAAAAKILYGCPAVVIDIGTATTLDVVDANGDYVGGAIAPGIRVAHDALVGRAARLHQIDLTPPPTAIGSNTIHAMQSGLVLGYIGLIEGLVRRIVDELGDPNTRVIATGGLARVLVGHTDVFEEYVPNLTLEGLRLLWEFNRKDEMG